MSSTVATFDLDRASGGKSAGRASDGGSENPASKRGSATSHLRSGGQRSAQSLGGRVSRRQFDGCKTATGGIPPTLTSLPIGCQDGGCSPGTRGDWRDHGIGTDRRDQHVPAASTRGTVYSHLIGEAVEVDRSYQMAVALRSVSVMNSR
jgi:hypothetical protein